MLAGILNGIRRLDMAEELCISFKHPTENAEEEGEPEMVNYERLAHEQSKSIDEEEPNIVSIKEKAVDEVTSWLGIKNIRCSIHYGDEDVVFGSSISTTHESFAEII